MKKTFIKLTFLMAFGSLTSQVVPNTKPHKKVPELTNSRWSLKIENCCTNYYDFKEHGSYVFYSGERDEYYPGVYTIKQDTLYLREFYSDEDDYFELLNREARFVALLDKNSLRLLCRQDPVLTKKGKIKWLKTLLDKSIYRKK